MEPFDWDSAAPLAPDCFQEAVDEWNQAQNTMIWGEDYLLSAEPWNSEASDEAPTTSFGTGTPSSLSMEELFPSDGNPLPETYEFFCSI